MGEIQTSNRGLLADVGCSDFSWMIGGPQGSGVDSSASLFAKTCAVAGYWVYGKREYHSNIKGEHSYFQVRVNTRPVHSHIDPVHLLATFEPSTAELHADELLPDGALIYDPAHTNPDKLPLPKDFNRAQGLYALDYTGILNTLAATTGKSVTQLEILKNTMSVAASLAIIGLPLSALETTLTTLFSGKKEKLLSINLMAAQLAYNAIVHNADAETRLANYPYRLKPQDMVPDKDSRVVMNAAVSIALGKVKAGCRMQTYYSITPAVDECIYLEDHPEFGTVVFQCEDELAAINMAVGAATTGVRASTSTSGPGFSLMAEGLGWAGINEVPVVVFNYQRGGPSTGLPTRHEQSDLLFSLFAGHGEFPRLVLSPGNVTEAYEDAFISFNWAERYQTPVIVLTDKALANNSESVPVFSNDRLTIDRGIWHQSATYTPQTQPADSLPNGQFPRFALKTEGVPEGLSPRSAPGRPDQIFWLTGDEHTELGHVTEDPTLRVAMHTKRMNKLDLALHEIPEDRQFRLFSCPQALQAERKQKILVVSWGSTQGPLLDALTVLHAEGLAISFLQVKLLWPFPSEAIGKMLGDARNSGSLLVGVEMNYTQQLGQLIRMQTGVALDKTIRKFTGRPMSQTELADTLRTIALGQGVSQSDWVLTHGK